MCPACTHLPQDAASCTFSHLGSGALHSQQMSKRLQCVQDSQRREWQCLADLLRGTLQVRDIFL